jgi:hypothetical protein
VGVYVDSRSEILGGGDQDVYGDDRRLVWSGKVVGGAAALMRAGSNHIDMIRGSDSILLLLGTLLCFAAPHCSSHIVFCLGWVFVHINLDEADTATDTLLRRYPLPSINLYSKHSTESLNSQ